MKPLVSFIITYYNKPVEQLKACIESILQLSLCASEREIILIDDGSDNSPLSQISEFVDETVFIRTRHCGLSIARNTGLKMAEGRFIQFIDADDQLIATPYEQCLDIIRYQEADMVIFSSTSHPHTTFTPEIVSAISGSELMRNQNIHGAAWGFLFRRNILGELRFMPDIYHEDEDFTPQLLLRAERVFRTHYEAYHYRRQADSITGKQDKATVTKRLNDTQTVIRHLYSLCDKLSPTDRPAMERRVAQLTMDYLYNTIIQTRSSEALTSRIASLTDDGLFPLPDRNYTQKYKWFRKLINSRWGQQVLLRTLPLLPVANQ